MNAKKKYAYFLEPNVELMRTNPDIFFEKDGTPKAFTMPKEGQMIVVPGRITVATLDDDGRIVSVE